MDEIFEKKRNVFPEILLTGSTVIEPSNIEHMYAKTCNQDNFQHLKNIQSSSRIVENCSSQTSSQHTNIQVVQESNSSPPVHKQFNHPVYEHHVSSPAVQSNLWNR